jgi:hypothetical protein
MSVKSTKCEYRASTVGDIIGLMIRLHTTIYWLRKFVDVALPYN